MALPTVAELKNTLRVETTAEDTVLMAMLASATGYITAWLRRPIASAARTYVIEDRRASSLAVGNLSREPRNAVAFIRIPDAPVATSPALVLTDKDGVTVDSGEYRLDAATGVVRGADGTTFGAFPYTAVATTGLGTRSDYATIVEPCIKQAILDVAADLYYRRNPNASSESGSGDSVSYEGGQLPKRVADLLGPFRGPLL